MAAIKVLCHKCLKRDVCREQGNYKFAIYSILQANTTTEPGCVVPVQDNDFLEVRVDCKMFYPGEV